MAEGKDLTTTQVADLLDVSRPFVTKLMTEGPLASHHVGSHRRCTMEDVMDYIDRREQAAADVARVAHAPATVHREFMDRQRLSEVAEDQLGELGFH